MALVATASCWSRSDWLMDSSGRPCMITAAAVKTIFCDGTTIEPRESPRGARARLQTARIILHRVLNSDGQYRSVTRSTACERNQTSEFLPRRRRAFASSAGGSSETKVVWQGAPGGARARRAPPCARWKKSHKQDTCVTGDTLSRHRKTPFPSHAPMHPAPLCGELTCPRGNPAEKRFLL